MSDVTRSCPICDAAPTWRGVPHKPGWWVICCDFGDGDRYEIEWIGASGVEYFNSDDNIFARQFFGPIPSPVRAAIPQAPNGGEGEK